MEKFNFQNMKFEQNILKSGSYYDLCSEVFMFKIQFRLDFDGYFDDLGRQHFIFYPDFFSVAQFIHLLNVKNDQARHRAPRRVGHVLKAETSSNNLFLQSSSYGSSKAPPGILSRTQSLFQNHGFFRISRLGTPKIANFANLKSLSAVCFRSNG